MLRRIGIGCGVLAGLFVLILVAVAIAGSGAGKATPTASPQAKVANPTHPAATRAPTAISELAACMPISKRLAQSLADALTIQGTAGIADARAIPVKVSDQDSQRYWLVGAKLVGQGMADTVAVWLTTVDPSVDAPSGGLIHSVDAVAKEFSQWPQPDLVRDRFLSSSERQLVLRCVLSAGK